MRTKLNINYKFSLVSLTTQRQVNLPDKFGQSILNHYSFFIRISSTLYTSHRHFSSTNLDSLHRHISLTLFTDCFSSAHSLSGSHRHFTLTILVNPLSVNDIYRHRDSRSPDLIEPPQQPTTSPTTHVSPAASIVRQAPSNSPDSASLFPHTQSIYPCTLSSGHQQQSPAPRVPLAHLSNIPIQRSWRHALKTLRGQLSPGRR